MFLSDSSGGQEALFASPEPNDGFGRKRPFGRPVAIGLTRPNLIFNTAKLDL
jgi:hypothetical protein